MNAGRVRTLIMVGLTGAAVEIYLSLVGLIEKFSLTNLVGDQFTLSRVMLALPPLVAAYVAVRPRVQAGQVVTDAPSLSITGGAIAGLSTGGATGLIVLVANSFTFERIRPVFIAASPRLLELLTFERPVGVGVVIFAIGCGMLGTLGGLARAVPAAVRRPVVLGLEVTILFGLLQRIIPIMMFQLGLETDWLYSRSTGGLTWFGALVVFAVTGGASVLWRRRGAAAGQRVREMVREQPSTRLLVSLIALGLLVVVPQLVGSVISEVLGRVAVFMLLGIGLNIVVGYAGLLDLGYVAFFGFGAYTTALLTGATLNTTVGSAAPAFSLHLNFYLAIPLVVLLAAGVGVLIGAPVLRLRGDYLAIVTLGLGEMASILIQSTWLAPVIGGPQGMRNVTSAPIAGFDFRDPQHFYYLGLAFVLLALFVSKRLASSRVGRAWNAMREDEQVAEAMGISTTRFKLLAFAMGGAIGSLGGALLAVRIGSLQEASFEILVSITALAVVVLGGMGSLPGVVVGALVLIGLPGLLREFEEYLLLIYGGTLIAIMVLRPQGLVPNVRRSMELHEEDVAQDEWARAEVAEGEPVPTGGEVQV